VIHYLEQNAHSEMKKNSPIIPETVADQIRLWESERNRVKYDKGVLYDAFPSEEAFNKVVKYAEEIGVFVWCNKQKKILMVTEEGHESLRPYIKKHV